MVSLFPNLKEDPMLSVHQLAVLLSISDGQARRLCRAGIVPAKNISAGTRHETWRVKYSDALRYRDTPDNQTRQAAVPSIPQLPPHIPQRA